jgi:hypothetical protein
MKKIANVAGYLFILSVAILTVVAILGVWDFATDETVWKAFQTIGLLGIVTLIVLFAERFIDRNPNLDNSNTIAVERFKAIRHFTVILLIVAIALLALFGVMSIWEILDEDVSSKALSSIGIVAFSAFLMIITSLNRENHKLLRRPEGHRTSVESIILLLIIVAVVLPFLWGLLRWFF